MAPTIFAEKKPSHMHRKLTKHTRRISEEAAALRNASRSVSRYHNSPAMSTSINYDNAIKQRILTDSVGDESNASSIQSAESLHCGTSSRTSATHYSDDTSLDQTMDTDDEEVYSIINSQKSAQYSERWQMLRKYQQIKNEPTILHNEMYKCLTKTKPVAVLNTRTTDKQCNNHTPYASKQCKNEFKSTYANLCDIKNAEGLLAIAIKTITLIKRNQLLQRRLAQLQLETSEFIASVLSNPENRNFREKVQLQHKQQRATTTTTTTPTLTEYTNNRF